MRALAVGALVVSLVAAVLGAGLAVGTVRNACGAAAWAANPPVYDCGGADPARVVSTFAFHAAVDAETAGSLQVPRRGGEPVTVAAQPVVTLADVQHLSLVGRAEGGADIAVELTEGGAARLAALCAQPGKPRLAVLLDGDCVHESAILAPLGRSFLLSLGLPDDEACALVRAVESRP